jgi:hypothetical protein
MRLIRIRPPKKEHGARGYLSMMRKNKKRTKIPERTAPGNSFFDQILFRPDRIWRAERRHQRLEQFRLVRRSGARSGAWLRPVARCTRNKNGSAEGGPASGRPFTGRAFSGDQIAGSWKQGSLPRCRRYPDGRRRSRASGALSDGPQIGDGSSPRAGR